MRQRMIHCRACGFLHEPDGPHGTQLGFVAPAGSRSGGPETQGVPSQSRRESLRIQVDPEVMDALRAYCVEHGIEPRPEKGRTGGPPHAARLILHRHLGLPDPQDPHEEQSRERKGRPRRGRATDTLRGALAEYTDTSVPPEQWADAKEQAWAEAVRDDEATGAESPD